MSQPVVELTDFETGMHGWEFKFWMPPDRYARAEIRRGLGLCSPHYLHLEADGRDDDGILFLQKTLTADIEGRYSWCAVSWWFKDDTATSPTSWPRVAYIGPPADLTRQETQHKFFWFKFGEGLTDNPSCKGWYGHVFQAKFEDGLDKMQVCIGWKINWETERQLALDNILLGAR